MSMSSKIKRFLLFSALVACVGKDGKSQVAIYVISGPNLPTHCSVAQGQVWFKTTATIGLYSCGPTNNSWTLASGGGGGSGTVTSTTCNSSFRTNWLTCSFGSSTTVTPILNLTPTTGQTSHKVIGTCGSNTTFTPCSLVAGDLPITIATTSNILKGDGSGNAVAATQTGTGNVVLQTSPTINTTLEVNANSGTLPSFESGGVLQLGGANGSSSRLEVDSFGGSAFFTSQRADGTAAIPTTLQSGDQIGGYNAWGYDGSAYIGPQASFRSYASQNWTTSAAGTYSDIAVTANNSTTMSESLRFENDGGITVPSTVTGGDKGTGTINAAGLFVNGTSVVTGGTVTSIATTSPITGGPITSSGTIACATCVVASAPGVGIAHFAGSTQTATSSSVSLTADVSGILPIANGGTGAATVATGTLFGNNTGSTAAPGFQNTALLSGNGASSAPGLLLTGTWFTGGSVTTTKPYMLVETAGATTNNWQTTGTGLGINGASGFSGYLIDAQTNGTEEFHVSGGGVLTARSDIVSSGGSLRASVVSSSGTGSSLTVMNQNFSAAGTATIVSSGTMTNSSGTLNAMAITPTYNQTNTAAGTDLYINRTETAVGSGAQYFINMAVGGVQKVYVDHLGNAQFLTESLTATQTTVNGSTSGSCIFSEPHQGSSEKRVLIQCNALVGTASYTYPVAYTYTPWYPTTSGLVGATVITALSTTAVTITGASSITGGISLEGF